MYDSLYTKFTTSIMFVDATRITKTKIPPLSLLANAASYISCPLLYPQCLYISDSMLAIASRKSATNSHSSNGFTHTAYLSLINPMLVITSTAPPPLPAATWPSFLAPLSFMESFNWCLPRWTWCMHWLLRPRQLLTTQAGLRNDDSDAHMQEVKEGLLPTKRPGLHPTTSSSPFEFTSFCFECGS